MPEFIRNPGASATRFRVVVATTVLLSFISFWRAAAIVLNDLGSSAFYAVGIAEEAFGKTAPWFSPKGETASFLLGPHGVSLRPEDQEMLHRLWLELTSDPALRGLHHDQLISVALRRMAAGLRGADRESIRTELRRLAGGARR